MKTLLKIPVQFSALCRSYGKLLKASIPMLAIALAVMAAFSYWTPKSAKAAFASTYFVRTDGSNGACNGLTNASAASAPNCAFLTIQFAVTTAIAGDTINVAAGTYNEAQVLIDKSVSVLGAGAATTTINGGNTPIATAGLVRINLPLTDTGNVVFSGFNLTNPGLTGSSRYHLFAKPLAPVSTITMSNLKITGVTASDYGLYSDRPIGTVVFDHSEIANTGFNPILIERPVGATDVHHNTISGNTSTAYFNFTYSGNDVAGKQRVADNIFNGANAAAISINGASTAGGGLGRYLNVEVSNNVITSLGAGRNAISLTNGAVLGSGAAGAIESPIVSGNTITGTSAANSKGIRLFGQINNASITGNNIRNVDRAISGEVNNSHAATGTQAHFNDLVGNLNGFWWDATSPVNAENNWWGCNFGPGAGGTGCSGTANGIAGAGAALVDANPWLTLTVAASPTSVPTGGASTVTTKLTINSDLVDTALGLIYVPATPVSFGATLGTVLPINGTLTNGTASTTFTAGGAPGAGSASSTADAQTVSAAITVTCPIITLAPASLPNATAGVFYSQNVIASPPGAYTYGLIAGSLPGGLNIDTGTGAITGTPTTTGTFNFSVAATISPCTGYRDYSITVTCPVVTVSPASLPNAQVNSAYVPTITGSPAGSYTFAVTNGSLPAGLTLNSNGSFSGAPTVDGIFNFRVTATAFGTCSGFRDYTLIVSCPTITVTPPTLPGGTVGTAYSQSVSASPAGTYVYTVSSGSLPTGLSLNAANGAITGTPTATGNFAFSIKASAGNCSGTQSYVVTIECATVTLTPVPLPAGQAGVAYSQTISASPAGSYNYSLLLGSLPAGLTLNPSTGALTGIPSGTGNFSFTVKAQAPGGCNGTQAYVLAIGCPTIVVSPASLPGGTTGTAYSQNISATPSSNYTFAVTSGALPPGLNLSPLGVLSGTPTANGSFTFTVTGSSFGGCTGSRSYTIVVGGGGCPTITLPAIGNGARYTPYVQSVTASPSAYYTYAVSLGSLPPGVVLYPTGILYGYPTSGGTFTFTITATNGACSGSRAYTVFISGPAGGSFAMVGDYDGDRKSDFVEWGAEERDWLILRSGAGDTHAAGWTARYDPTDDVLVAGDYDGDGRYDVALFRHSTGEWLIQRSSDGETMVEQWGEGTPVPADYDGDGRTDIAVWQSSSGKWSIKRSSDGGEETAYWGVPGAGFFVPVVADYDGDGKADLAVYRVASHRWEIRQSSDGLIVERELGRKGDVPLAGDFDGDGKTDLAVWRAASNELLVLTSREGFERRLSVDGGNRGEVPVLGDYDGDGKIDLAVRQGGDRGWRVKLSGGDVQASPVELDVKLPPRKSSR